MLLLDRALPISILSRSEHPWTKQQAPQRPPQKAPEPGAPGDVRFEAGRYILEKARGGLPGGRPLGRQSYWGPRERFGVEDLGFEGVLTMIQKRMVDLVSGRPGPQPAHRE